MIQKIRFHKLINFSLLIFGLAFFPDIKFGVIKISEIISIFIGLYFILTIEKIKKWVIVFSILILYLFIVMLYKSNTELLFFPETLTILKKPIIFPSLKLFSLFINVLLVGFLFNKLKHKSKILLKYLMISLINLSILFSCFFIIYWFGIKNGFIQYNPSDYDNSLIVYSYSYRIKGFFYEGGPLGMYFASLFLLQYFIYSKYRILKLLYILFFLIVFSQSKYGVLFIFVFLAFFYFNKYKSKLNIFILPITLLFIIIGLTITYSISKNYIDDLRNTEYQVHTPKNDNPNFYMGRIPAVTQIIPNILKYNLLTGIGIFNYQFIRNNPKYKGFWKESPTFGDNPGMGFFFEVLYGGGLIGVILYFITIYYIRRKIIKGEKAIIYFNIFFLSQFFGTSLTFFYPWIYFLLSLFNSSDEDN